MNFEASVEHAPSFWFLFHHGEDDAGREWTHRPIFRPPPLLSAVLTEREDPSNSRL